MSLRPGMMLSGLDCAMGQLQGFPQVWWAKLRDEIHEWHATDPPLPPHQGHVFCDAHSAPNPHGGCKDHRVHSVHGWRGCQGCQRVHTQVTCSLPPQSHANVHV
jgi:hypothetical protein